MVGKKGSVKGMAVLGYFVWWNLRNAKIDRATFNDLIEKSGLDNPPPKECKRTAFLEAVRSTKAKSHSNQLLVRNLLKSKEEHLFGLVDEEVNEAQKKLGYEHSATLRFDQATHQVSCDKQHRAFDLVQAKYEDNLVNYNSYELRRWVQKVIDSVRSVTVRDDGGVYYIDAQYEPNLEKLDALLKNVPGCNFEMVPQVDLERSRKAIYRAYVEDLRHKMKKYREKIDKEQFTSAKGWKNALDNFKELREEIGFYADRLQFTADDLHKELEQLQKDVKAKLVD